MSKKWKREDITPEVLRQLLRLDEETGKLYWRERGPEWFSSEGQRKVWNKRFSGREALCSTSNGRAEFGKILYIDFTREEVVSLIKGKKDSFGERIGTKVSAQELRDMLSLNPETGKRTWKPVGCEWFASQASKNSFASRCVGKRHPAKMASNVMQCEVFGSTISEGRLNWAIYYGEFPDGRITYRDGDPANVSIENLLLVPYAEAAGNAQWEYGKKIGRFFGVSFCTKSGKYESVLDQVRISEHATPIEAARAYDKAAFDKWGEHARLNFPEDYGLVRADTDAPDGYFD